MGVNVATIEVAENCSALVQVLVVDELIDDDAVTNTSLLEHLNVDDLLRPIRAIAERARDALAIAKPSKLTLECGIAVALKNGKLTTLLVQGQADVAMKLTVEWDLEKDSGSLAGDLES